ncbi:MAG: MMPL family transporter [Oscillospiraceae bacterium]|nr:MMPL family transporter [Oscillospiraceae bacterium]
MEKIFLSLLKHKKLVLILAAALFALAAFSTFQTTLNSDVTRYLPGSSVSKQTIDVLRENFGINGDAEITASGTSASYAELKALIARISDLDGVSQVQWLGSYEGLFSFNGEELVSAEELIPDANVQSVLKNLFFKYEGETYYSLLISLTAPNATAEAADALHELDAVFSEYSGSYYLGGSAVQSNDMLESALGELPQFIIVAAVIVMLILLVTTPSVAAALVILLTIGGSIVFNLGTNFFTPDVSMVTFSITAILQLALSMDYSIFLIHAYIEERKTAESDEKAMLCAMKKTLAVIVASAATTIAGFLALFAMKYTMGADLGLCLAKGVLLSLLTVLIVQPCLMLSLRRFTEKSTHRALNPGFSFLTRLPKKLRVAAPALALALIIPAAVLANSVSYYYLDSGYSDSASGPRAAAQSAGTQAIFVTPTVSAQKQLWLAQKLDKMEAVSGITGYYALLGELTQGLTIPIYSSLTEQNEDTLLIDYTVSPEMALEALEGGMTDDVMSSFDGQLTPELEEIVRTQLESFQGTLESFAGKLGEFKSAFFADIGGESYTFFTAKVLGEPEGKKALETVDLIRRTAESTLETELIYTSGSSQTVSDLAATTETDMLIVSGLSALLIFIIVFFTFKDVKVSLLLIVLIELAIFINLSISRLMRTSLNFMSYIVISAIQLGSTIDYAILMTKNYRLERSSASPYAAISRALRRSAFPIVISVSILCAACLSVYFISGDTIIREITLLIARGSFISGLLVLFILPAVLPLLGNKRPQAAA